MHLDGVVMQCLNLMATRPEIMVKFYPKIYILKFTKELLCNEDNSGVEKPSCNPVKEIHC